MHTAHRPAIERARHALDQLTDEGIIDRYDETVDDNGRTTFVPYLTPDAETGMSMTAYQVRCFRHGVRAAQRQARETAAP